MAWSPDNKRLYATSESKVYAWEWPKFRPVLSWTAEPDEIKALAVSADGKRVATAGQREIHIWRADRVDAAEKTFPAPAGNVSCLCWCPDHRRLIVGMFDGVSTLIDIESEVVQPFSEQRRTIGVAWNSSQRVAVTLSTIGVLESWNLESLERRSTRKLLESEAKFPHDAIHSFQVAWLEEGRSVFESNRVYDTETGVPYATFLFFNGGRMIRIAAEGSFVGPEGIEKELVAVVKTDAGEFQTLSLDEFANRYGWKNAAATNSPAKTVAASQTAGEEGFVSLWDGKSFTDWKVNENKESWRIEDGCLVCNGPRSHLFYTGKEAPFTNFELRVDCKTTPGSNSGIYFHTRFQEDGWPKYGFEAQVHNSYVDPRRTGSLYGVIDVTEPPAKDNEWFTQTVIVSGNKIMIKVNGMVMANYTEPADTQPGVDFTRKIDSGTFALQSYEPEGKVYFKNIRVKRLP
jgi:hypothetical protein